MGFNTASPLRAKQVSRNSLLQIPDSCRLCEARACTRHNRYRDDDCLQMNRYYLCGGMVWKLECPTRTASPTRICPTIVLRKGLKLITKSNMLLGPGQLARQLTNSHETQRIYVKLRGEQPANTCLEYYVGSTSCTPCGRSGHHGVFYLCVSPLFLNSNKNYK